MLFLWSIRHKGERTIPPTGMESEPGNWDVFTKLKRHF